MKKKPRVLVVEDDRTSRKLLCRIVDGAGYEAIEAAEARDALHILEMWAPDAMIIDIMLPDKQGTDLVREMVETPEFRSIEILFLTGILSKKAGELKYKIEVCGKSYPAQAKPINPEFLLTFLAEATARIEVRKAKEEKQAKALAQSAALPVTPRRAPEEKPERASNPFELGEYESHDEYDPVTDNPLY